MDKLLSLVDVKGFLKVVRIDGGAKVENELNKLSIKIGSIVEVLERGIKHPHFGPLIVKTEKDVLIPRGIAEKIFVDGKKLLDIEKGKFKITNLDQLNSEMRKSFSKIGIEGGKEIEIKGHDKEKTYVFNIEGKNYTFGDGEAAKILVKSKEGLIQANFLEGEGTIEDIIGGNEVFERFGKDLINKKIKIVSKEEKKLHEDLSQSVTLKVNGKEIILGKGLAEKIWGRRV